MSMTTSPTFPCPCCVFRGMKVALDKKGRPYFRCETCSTIIFVRLGAIGVHSVANTLRLLENAQAAEWVRTEAFKDAAAPGQGLPDLVGVSSTDATTAITAEDPEALKKAG